MSDKKTYTGLSKEVVLVPARSVYTVDYMDTKPNYFRVQNHGSSAIFCSTGSIPTTNNYDFMVAGSGMKFFAEPFERTKLYIYNPTASEVEVIVVSFAAEFDPLALALSDLEIDLPGTVEMSGVISGFTASLPSGSNTIGKVTLGSGSSKIGKVDIATMPDMMKEGKTVSFVDYFYDLHSMVRNINYANQIHAVCESGTGAKDFFPTNNNVEICEIGFLSNDSETQNLVFSIHCLVNNTDSTMTLKPGEVLNNVKCKADKISITSAGAFRILYNQRKNISLGV